MSMDDVRVEQWRTEQFDRLGFSSTQVTMLVRWGADLGQVRSLIEGGCPLHLAMRIMRPLEDPPVIPLLAHAEQYNVKV